MVQRDVYVRKPSLNKLECGQNTANDLQELVTSCRVFRPIWYLDESIDNFISSMMKALPEDELGKIEDDDDKLNLVQGMCI